MKGIHGMILGALLAAVVVMVAPHAGDDTTAAATDGKSTFLAAKCDMCHSVPTADITAKAKVEKLKGPDLTSDVANHDSKLLTAYLRREGELEGNQHKKGFTGSDEELAKILEWLAQQKVEPGS